MSIFILILFVPTIADATSGACSWHGGVDCSMGRQSNGKVYCNDGWTDSMASYDFMVKCESSSSNSCWGYSPDCKYLSDLDLLNHKKSIALKRLDEAIELIEKMEDIRSTHNDLLRGVTDEFTKIKIDLTIKRGYLLGNYMDYVCKCTKIDEILDLYSRDSLVDISPEVIENAIDMLGGGENETNYGDIKGEYKLPEGALIRAYGDIDIYIVKYAGAKKFKRLILSPSVFNNYGHLRWEDVIDVDQATLDEFTTSSLVRAVGDDKIYWLYAQGDTGGKRLIKSQSVFTKYGLDTDGIYEINRFDRDSYETEADLE